jgi:hypothetical protein
MKPVLTKAIAVALSTYALSAVAASGNTPQLPKQFTDVSATMQSRICGELMTSLAMGGVQALQMQFPGGKVPEAQRKQVYETGAQSVVLLAMAGSLSLDGRLKAGEIAGAIEGMDPKVHVDTARFCQRRVEAWIKAGEVKKDIVDKAYVQSKELLDKEFSMSEDHSGDSE